MSLVGKITWQQDMMIARNLKTRATVRRTELFLLLAVSYTVYHVYAQIHTLASKPSYGMTVGNTHTIFAHYTRIPAMHIQRFLLLFLLQTCVYIISCRFGIPR